MKLRRITALALTVHLSALIIVALAQVKIGIEPRLVASYPLLSRLVVWHRVMADKYGGPTWYSLTGMYNATLTNMSTVGSSGWVPAKDTLPNGEVAFDGTDDYVNVADDSALDFAATGTFTVSVRFHTTTTAVGYLAAKRLSGASIVSGGWFIRMEATTGVLKARLLENGNITNAERATANAYNDGKGHRVTVIFKPDVSVAAASDLTVYVDGKVDQGGLTSGTQTYIVCSAPCPLVYGGLSDASAGNFWSGFISDVMIFRGSLTDGEINSLDQIPVGWNLPPEPSDLLTLLVNVVVNKIKHKVVHQ